MWSTLLAVEAGASATLTGLVFVAVSLNLDRVLSFPGLIGRAAEPLLQLLQIFFIATLALVPGPPTKLLAGEFLAIAATFWIIQIKFQINFIKAHVGNPWRWFMYRIVLSQLGTIPFCVAGILLLLGRCGGVYWLVPGFIFSFASAMLSSWVLLIEIRR